MKLTAWFAAGFFLLLLVQADAAREGAMQGIQLACYTAIPALFPFFVASSLLQKSGLTAIFGKLFEPLMRRYLGLPGEVAGAFVLGVTGGYPVGAAAVCNLYEAKHLTKMQAQTCLSFCNNTGPAFIVGVCGVGVFGSVKIGLFLYAVHILSALICAKCFTRKQHIPTATTRATKNTAPFSQSFVQACEQAAQTSIRVAAFLVLFCVFSALLRSIGMIPLVMRFIPVSLQALFYAVLSGALELTQGIAALPDVPMTQALPCASAMLAFGGGSVWCQSMSIVQNAGLSMSSCIWGKMLHTVVAMGLTLPFAAWAAQTVPTISTGIYLPVLPAQVGIVLTILILCIFTTGKVCKNTL